MIHPLVMLVVVTTLYPKRGGHYFFIFKSGVIPENTRFLIKTGCQTWHYHYSKGGNKMISYKPLWETMNTKGMSTYTLRNKGNEYCLSGSTIARLQAGESISTNTLDALCHILDCQLQMLLLLYWTNKKSITYCIWNMNRFYFIIPIWCMIKGRIINLPVAILG